MFSSCKLDAEHEQIHCLLELVNLRIARSDADVAVLRILSVGECGACTGQNNTCLLAKLHDALCRAGRCIEADKVTMEATFRGDLGLDSLDTYELMYSLEAETGVKVPDEVAATFVKVQDVYDYIKKQGN